MVSTVLKVPVGELFDGTAATSSSTSRTTTPAFDPQALRLAEAFVKISDKALRSSLVDVVEALARKSASNAAEA
jgi:hypothetical protein